MQAWFARYLAPGSPHRRKLVVHVQPTKPGCAALSAEGAKLTAGKGERHVVADVLEWRQTQEIYPVFVGPDPRDGV